MKRTIALLGCALVLAGTSPAALAEVTVKEPWVRGTVAGQAATGAFMQLTSNRDARLVSARSPVSGVAEIHEMKMVDNVMKMREVQAVDLPAGKTVTLAPGGYHVMMMDLKRPLGEGDTVPLELTIESRDGKRETVSVNASVRKLGAMPEGQAHKH